MGLIRDGIGAALGANQVNNGFNGPKIPFMNNNPSSSCRPSNRPSASPRPLSSSSSFRRDSPPSSFRRGGSPPYSSQRGDSPPPSYERSTYESSNNGLLLPRGPPPPLPPREEPRGRYARSSSPPRTRYGEREDYFDEKGYGYGSEKRFENQYMSSPYRDEKPSRFNPFDSSRGHGAEDRVYQDLEYQDREYPSRGYDARSMGYDSSYRSSQQYRSGGSGGFRPIALPQIEYGDGKPFLRGYSNELAHYGIYRDDFIRLLDTINVAVVPNPEVQIFQKGANIAGWFIPGSASLGLMAGQFGVGIAAAFGHASAVAKALSKANLDLFVPNGLELCIGHTKDVDAEVGVSSSNQGNAAYGSTPEDRIAAYGGLLAPLSDVRPPLQNIGRNDPIAMLGRGIGNRDNQRKVRRADKEMSKGKGKDKKSSAMEGGIKWLMVRQATPDAMAHWQKTLEDSEAALRQEQQQGR